MPKKQLRTGPSKLKKGTKVKGETLYVVLTRKKKGTIRDVLRKTKKPALKLNINLNRPLSPAYHPSRVVSQVWQENHQLEDLYRYTHFDRMVYPPGFVQEEMNNNH